MLTEPAPALGLEAALAHYEEHGYARLGRVLSDEGLATLRERTRALMMGELVHEGMFFQMDATTGRYEDAPLGLGWQGPSLGYRKLEKLEKDPCFRAWLSNPLFARLVGARLGPGARLYRAVLFNKGPHGGTEVPWHQDAGKLWGLSKDPELQLWTALDDAPWDGGCLEVVPGSHRAGLVTPLGGVVPAEAVAKERASARAVPLPAQAGEVILLHNLLWHRTGHGHVGGQRRAFSACYLSADTRCVRKHRPPRQFLQAFP